jgi:hypothetical protein
MRMRTDLRGPAIVRLGAVDDLQTERRRQGCEIGDVLIGGEPRAESFANEADQRAHPQRQKRVHLVDDAKPGHHVLRIDRGRPHALIEQEWRDADDDVDFQESIGLAVHRGL